MEVLAGIALYCKNCSRGWVYRGKSQTYAICPLCHRKINIMENRQLLGGEEFVMPYEAGLTKTELIGYKYLQQKGYHKTELEKTSHHLPDFISLADDNRFEIKTLDGNKLNFTQLQVDFLRPSDFIIVVKNDDVIDSFPWRTRDMRDYMINIIKGTRLFTRPPFKLQEIICSHCHNKWLYKGKSKIYATCPQCLRKTLIKKRGG